MISVKLAVSILLLVVGVSIAVSAIVVQIEWILKLLLGIAGLLMVVNSFCMFRRFLKARKE